MKKTLILLGALFFAFPTFTQLANSNPNTPEFVSSFINPSASRGFMAWEKVPEANYEVHLYTYDENKNEVLIDMITTEKNYVKIDLKKEIYIVSTGLYSKTISINKSTGNVIDVGIEIELIPEGSDPLINTCNFTCNGINYAYTIGWWQKMDADGSGRINPHNSGRLIPRSAYEYYDANNFGIPYYRAFDSDGYLRWRDQEIKNHPIETYDIYTAEIKREDFICNSSGQRLEGTIYFVEKKFEEYKNFNGLATDFFNNSAMCQADLGFVIEDYNFRVENPLIATGDYDRQGNMIYVEQEIACTPYPSCGGSTGGGGDNDNDWDYEPDFIDCLIESTEANYIGCFEDAEDDNPGGNGGPGKDRLNDLPNQVNGGFISDNNNSEIISLQLTRLDKREERLIINNPDINKMENYLSSLNNGLYRAHFVLKNYKVIPVVFENIVGDKNNLGQPKFADKASLDIAPNPFQEKIKVNIGSNVNTTATLKVYDLNGINIYSEDLVLEDNTKAVITRAIDVESVSPYGQWRVVLSFSDGSEIAKTAIRE